jgi:lipopolysaccharide biosynthesis glycosyltransferase
LYHNEVKVTIEMNRTTASSLQKACCLVALAVVGASLSLLSSRSDIHVRNDNGGLSSLHEADRSNRTGDAAAGPSALVNPAHVVFASTDDMIPGVEASIRSIQAHASGPVQFHYIGDSPLRSIPDVKFYSLAEVSQKYKLQDFVCLGDRGDGQNNINTLHANYARFVLDALLPRTVEKAMYLDVDTAVFCDVNSLIDGVLNDVAGRADEDDSPVIAAVPRNHIYGLTQKGEKKFGRHISPSFNAGAYVVNLSRWRDRKMGGFIREIAKTNNKEHWYYLGSQPPLNIAIGPNFEWLSLGWNVKAKRVKAKFKTKSGEEVCLVHWTGPVKPWQTNDTNVVDLLDIWKQYGKRSRAEGEKTSRQTNKEGQSTQRGKSNEA